MDFSWVWKAVLIIVAGTFLLRFAGRKSISQMTLAQTVIMIGIGSLLVQPVAGRNIWVTIGVGAVLILTLIAMEYGQIKSDKLENFITGKSKMVIENGEVNVKNLKKMRLTVDQLEMKLRQGNVARINDIKWATLEPNGQIGFLLKDQLQPATKQDVEQIQKDIQELKMLFNQRLPKVKLITKFNEPAVEPTPPASQKQENDQPDIFSEVNYKSHETPPPKYLQ
ncbi:DUF421 domain-containing protein [Bacillus luteolus]|uniref:DUF421 domain-containing protein n=1 Tax=Litchfieldia luteola TaxID=682179 RepID=A0ABR9QHI7_9BACI|nr:DUF421 domain-containing protein [Cytobacillus luteolus]MBE4907955.1 DUF421 domain-containing protein [Cytobacillus luteolus]MBP1942734.1 uncharacterized membrane protein YcaP (DUF421 family) [Cytobacillus luteolus]